jgi:hypothetical protein
MLGQTQIDIAVTDNLGGVATQSYTLTTRQNHAPVISSTPTTQITLGNTYRYDVVATDSDNDALTYTLDDASTALGLTIDKFGRMTWKPTNTNIGTHTITVSVSDTLSPLPLPLSPSPNPNPPQSSPPARYSSNNITLAAPSAPHESPPPPRSPYPSPRSGRQFVPSSTYA